MTRRPMHHALGARGLRAWSAALVLTSALLAAAHVRAQDPIPGDPARPPPNQGPAEREPDTDMAPAAPRPAPRRRPPAPVVPPAAVDAGTRAADPDVAERHPTAGSSPDGGTTEAPDAQEVYAGDPLDGGVPDLSLTEAAGRTDGGTTDQGTAAAIPAAPAPVSPDAGHVLPQPTVAVPVPVPTFVQLPAPLVPPGEVSDPWAGLREIIPGIPTGGIGPLSLLLILLLLALLSASIERLRGRLLRDGWLPALLSFLQVSARLVGLLVALSLVVQVVPGDVRWVVYFILMASGAALGWSTRDVMPDLIAGVVMIFERRIRRGVWVRTSELSGAVERVGLRSSWLRTARGERVAVPNRVLMQDPVVTDEEGATLHEVLVRMPGAAQAADVRRALCDAVLASPWTRPDAEPLVLRDASDPDLWHVRGRLLSASFAVPFQGQLLERAEAHLAALTNGSGPPTLDKSEKPDKTDKTERAPKPP